MVGAFDRLPERTSAMLARFLLVGRRRFSDLAVPYRLLAELRPSTTGSTRDAIDSALTLNPDASGDPDIPGVQASRLSAASRELVVAVSRNVDARELLVSGLKLSDGSAAWPALASRQTSTAASAPAIAGDLIVVGLPDRFVHAISTSDGTERWQALGLSVYSPVTSPAASDDTIYAADLGGGLYALNAADGTRRWDHQLNDLVLRSAPVRSGADVLLGLQDGRLVVVDDADGHLVWQSAPTPGLIGAIALAPDVVVAVKGGREAGLIAFETDPDGHLIDVASPTELDLGVTLPRLALGAAIALVVVLVPGFLARRRFGDAFAQVDDEADDAADEEPDV